MNIAFSYGLADYDRKVIVCAKAKSYRGSIMYQAVEIAALPDEADIAQAFSDAQERLRKRFLRWIGAA